MSITAERKAEVQDECQPGRDTGSPDVSGRDPVERINNSPAVQTT